MPELPWRKWFPQDWKGDPKLTRCTPSTRGIWADAVSTMMMLELPYLEGTVDQMARDCRCLPSDIESAHADLEKTGAANVSMQNGCIKWTCRRLQREHEISLKRRNAALGRWSKSDANGHANACANADAKAHARSVSVSSEYSSNPDLDGIVKGVLRETVNFMTAWSDLISHRIQLGIGMTTQEARILIGTLSKRPEGSVSAIREIIRKRWMSFEWEYIDNPRTAPKKNAMSLDELHEGGGRVEQPTGATK